MEKEVDELEGSIVRARNPEDGVLSQHWRSPTAQFRHEYSLSLQAELWRKSEREQKLLQHQDPALHEIAVIAPLLHHRKLSKSVFNASRPSLGTITTQQ